MTNEPCGNDTCIDRDELKELVEVLRQLRNAVDKAIFFEERPNTAEWMRMLRRADLVLTRQTRPS